MEKLIAGINVAVNEEGYLINFAEWNKDIGYVIAAEADNRYDASPLGSYRIPAKGVQK
jgi:hypothetical protein